MVRRLFLVLFSLFIQNIVSAQDHGFHGINSSFVCGLHDLSPSTSHPNNGTNDDRAVFWSFPSILGESGDFTFATKLSFSGWAEVAFFGSHEGRAGSSDGDELPSLVLSLDGDIAAGNVTVQTRTFDCEESSCINRGQNPCERHIVSAGGSRNVCVRNSRASSPSGDTSPLWVISRRQGHLSIRLYEHDDFSGTTKSPPENEQVGNSFVFPGKIERVGIYSWVGEIHVEKLCLHVYNVTHTTTQESSAHNDDHQEDSLRKLSLIQRRPNQYICGINESFGHSSYTGWSPSVFSNSDLLSTKKALQAPLGYYGAPEPDLVASWMLPSRVAGHEDFSVKVEFATLDDVSWWEIVLEKWNEDGLGRIPRLVIMVDGVSRSMQLRVVSGEGQGSGESQGSAGCSGVGGSSAPESYSSGNDNNNSCLRIREAPEEATFTLTRNTAYSTSSSSSSNAVSTQNTTSTNENFWSFISEAQFQNWKLERRGGNITISYNDTMIPFEAFNNPNPGKDVLTFFNSIDTVSVYKWSGEMALQSICAKHGNSEIWEDDAFFDVVHICDREDLDPCGVNLLGKTVDTECIKDGANGLSNPEPNYSCRCGKGTVNATHAANHSIIELRNKPGCIIDTCAKDNALGTWFSSSDLIDLTHPPCGLSPVDNPDTPPELKNLDFVCKSSITRGMTTLPETFYDCTCPFPYVEKYHPYDDASIAKIRQGQKYCALPETTPCDVVDSNVDTSHSLSRCGPSEAGICVTQWLNITSPYRCECNKGYTRISRTGAEGKVGDYCETIPLRGCSLDPMLSVNSNSSLLMVNGSLVSSFSPGFMVSSGVPIDVGCGEGYQLELDGTSFSNTTMGFSDEFSTRFICHDGSFVSASNNKMDVPFPPFCRRISTTNPPPSTLPPITTTPAPIDLGLFEDFDDDVPTEDSGSLSTIDSSLSSSSLSNLPDGQQNLDDIGVQKQLVKQTLAQAPKEVVSVVSVSVAAALNPATLKKMTEARAKRDEEAGKPIRKPVIDLFSEAREMSTSASTASSSSSGSTASDSSYNSEPKSTESISQSVRSVALEYERVVKRSGRDPSEEEWDVALWLFANADLVQEMCERSVLNSKSSASSEQSDNEYAFVKTVDMGKDRGVVAVMKYAGGESVPAAYKLTSTSSSSSSSSSSPRSRSLGARRNLAVRRNLGRCGESLSVGGMGVGGRFDVARSRDLEVEDGNYDNDYGSIYPAEAIIPSSTRSLSETTETSVDGVELVFNFEIRMTGESSEEDAKILADRVTKEQEQTETQQSHSSPMSSSESGQSHLSDSSNDPSSSTSTSSARAQPTVASSFVSAIAQILDVPEEEKETLFTKAPTVVGVETKYAKAVPVNEWCLKAWGDEIKQCSNLCGEGILTREYYCDINPILNPMPCRNSDVAKLDLQKPCYSEHGCPASLECPLSGPKDNSLDASCESQRLSMGVSGIVIVVTFILIVLWKCRKPSGGKIIIDPVGNSSASAEGNQRQAGWVKGSLKHATGGKGSRKAKTVKKKEATWKRVWDKEGEKWKIVWEGVLDPAGDGDGGSGGADLKGIQIGLKNVDEDDDLLAGDNGEKKGDNKTGGDNDDIKKEGGDVKDGGFFSIVVGDGVTSSEENKTVEKKEKSEDKNSKDLREDSFLSDGIRKKYPQPPICFSLGEKLEYCSLSHGRWVPGVLQKIDLYSNTLQLLLMQEQVRRAISFDKIRLPLRMGEKCDVLVHGLWLGPCVVVGFKIAGYVVERLDGAGKVDGAGNAGKGNKNGYIELKDEEDETNGSSHDGENVSSGASGSTEMELVTFQKNNRTKNTRKNKNMQMTLPAENVRRRFSKQDEVVVFYNKKWRNGVVVDVVKEISQEDKRRELKEQLEERQREMALKNGRNSRKSGRHSGRISHGSRPSGGQMFSDFDHMGGSVDGVRRMSVSSSGSGGDVTEIARNLRNASIHDLSASSASSATSALATLNGDTLSVRVGSSRRSRSRQRPSLTSTVGISSSSSATGSDGRGDTAHKNHHGHAHQGHAHHPHNHAHHAHAHATHQHHQQEQQPLSIESDWNHLDENYVCDVKLRIRLEIPPDDKDKEDEEKESQKNHRESSVFVFGFTDDRDETNSATEITIDPVATIVLPKEVAEKSLLSSATDTRTAHTEVLNKRELALRQKRMLNNIMSGNTQNINESVPEEKLPPDLIKKLMTTEPPSSESLGAKGRGLSRPRSRRSSKASLPPALDEGTGPVKLDGRFDSWDAAFRQGTSLSRSSRSGDSKSVSRSASIGTGMGTESSATHRYIDPDEEVKSAGLTTVVWHDVSHDVSHIESVTPRNLLQKQGSISSSISSSTHRYIDPDEGISDSDIGNENSIVGSTNSVALGLGLGGKINNMSNNKNNNKKMNSKSSVSKFPVVVLSPPIENSPSVPSESADLSLCVTPRPPDLTLTPMMTPLSMLQTPLEPGLRRPKDPLAFYDSLRERGFGDSNREEGSGREEDESKSVSVEINGGRDNSNSVESAVTDVGKYDGEK